MDDNGQPRPPILLDTNDILGIIQRAATELHQYCQQHPQHVDPSVVMNYLSKMADFTTKLGQHAPPPAGKESGAGLHGKAN